jgi:ABC-2 type transport system permease protein
MSRPATWSAATRAQAAMELRLTGRRGENLLVVAVIPAVVLVFFSSTSLLTAPGRATVDFLLPGTLALAVIATGLVNLGIATAYERSYGVLKRLGGSPLGRTGMVASKLVAVGVIVALQAVLLFAVALLLLAWRPSPELGIGALLVSLALGAATFAAIGLLLAGAIRAEATLALANGLFIAALLLGGVIIPVTDLPQPLATIAEWLPAAALSEALRASLGGDGDLLGSLVRLAAWGLAAGAATTRWFRWD